MDQIELSKQCPSSTQSQEYNLYNVDQQIHIEVDEAQKYGQDNVQKHIKFGSLAEIDSNIENDGKSSNSMIRSQEQLKSQFAQNQKKLIKLSSNIDDLFQKINSLTEQYEKDSPIKHEPKLQHKWKSQVCIPHSEPTFPIPNNVISIGPTLLRQPVTQEQYNRGLSMKMFQMGKRLGYGKFGEVFECRNKQTRQIYALKKIFKSTIQKYEMHEQLLTQIKCCSQVQHPNIMKSYTSFTDQYHIFLVSQYLQGQRLTKKFNSSQTQVSRIIKQVIEAVQYLHKNGIVHRDLKPENIIIDESGMIKICDFGWANMIKITPDMFILCGTLDYVCPEMVLNQKYSEKVDLWSIGILTYELIFGQAPFKEEDRNSTFQRVKKLDLKFPTQKSITKQCKDFIEKLLKIEEERMSIQECLKHSYIKYSQPIVQQFENEINDLI